MTKYFSALIIAAAVFAACNKKPADNPAAVTTNTTVTGTPTSSTPAPAAPEAVDAKTAIVGDWSVTHGAAMMESYSFKADGTYSGVSGRDEFSGKWAVEGDKFKMDEGGWLPIKFEGKNKMVLDDRTFERN